MERHRLFVFFLTHAWGTGSAEHVVFQGAVGEVFEVGLPHQI